MHEQLHRAFQEDIDGLEAIESLLSRYAERQPEISFHAGHGIFTTGQSVDEAAWWFVLMNRCCEAQLMAQACGTPSLWGVEDARWLASVLGSPQFGWLSFQTLWDDIILSDPDLVQ